MTLPRLAAMNKHWEHFPPVHISLARLNRALLTEEKKEEKKGLADFLADWGNSANVG